MLGPCQDDEVLGFPVERVAVEMVDDLILAELATLSLLHDESVRKARPPSTKVNCATSLVEVATYYHVHRGQGLPGGQTLDLATFRASPPELDQHLHDLFPTGLTQHGAAYLGLLPDRLADATQNGWREAIFEFVRRSIEPTKPSRFQSIFACDSVEDAGVFRRSICSGQGSIYEVAAKEAFRVNMSLLNESSNYLAVSDAAHAYWRGEPGYWPAAWEELLVPPVTVVRQIDS